MMNDPGPAVVANEDGISENPCDEATGDLTEAAATGCPYANDALATMNSPNHKHGPMQESRRPLGVAGREGVLSVIDDLTGLIESSRRSSNSFRESEGRLAQVELSMCKGYERAKVALQNLLRADLATSRRIAEKNRPEVDVECVGGF